MSETLARLFDAFFPLLLIGAIVGAALAWRSMSQRYLLHQRLVAHCSKVAQWTVHTRTFPGYRFVDLAQAMAWLADEHPGSEVLPFTASNHLGSILNGRLDRSDMFIQQATMVPRKIGPVEEAFLPAQSFVLLNNTQRRKQTTAIIRMRELFAGQLMIEVAAPCREQAEKLIHTIAERASTHSIYRNRMVRLVPGAHVRAAFVENGSQSPLDLMFVADEPVTDADIVLDPAIQGILARTVVDFHKRRSELMQLALPARRGVLFYGPPGTGKTFTCKYLSHQLRPITTVVATGNALYQMAAICAIAKSLQPALVLLEDVDLVFTDRAQNATPTLLGEFFDQLDGFETDDEVIFVLTTNALERVEAALKDRPGRISQCLYFGPPSAQLRRQYLAALLARYDASALDLGRVVARTEGVSQAFLKELVFRTVQLASAQPNAASPLAVHDEDVALAFDDMTTGAGPSGKRIIGFRVDE